MTIHTAEIISVGRPCGKDGWEVVGIYSKTILTFAGRNHFLYVNTNTKKPLSVILNLIS